MQKLNVSWELNICINDWLYQHINISLYWRIYVCMYHLEHMYRVAAINPEFFSSYFQMTQHSWKSSNLIEVKTNLHRYISRIILCIKTAVSINNSPDPGPQALAGLHHGVPVDEPHHILYLLNTLQWPIIQIRPTKSSEKMTIRRAGRPDLLLLHLRNSALPKALNLHHGTSGARSEDCPCSCAFLLIHLRPSATVCFYFCFGRKLRWFCAKKTIKNIIF